MGNFLAGISTWQPDIAELSSLTDSERIASGAVYLLGAAGWSAQTSACHFSLCSIYPFPLYIYSLFWPNCSPLSAKLIHLYWKGTFFMTTDLNRCFNLLQLTITLPTSTESPPKNNRGVAGVRTLLQHLWFEILLFRIRIGFIGQVCEHIQGIWFYIANITCI